ncbi:MAG: SCP2 sterol-binding domain-containing protein [Myxococcales bacterium]|nr:SCP2 sterol-binding domain-containing protein [Myxococcales bacterium]
MTEGAAGDCTLEISEADFIDMTTGKSDPMKLFTTGKLKIAGNVMASQKLNSCRRSNPERGQGGGREGPRCRWRQRCCGPGCGARRGGLPEG